MYFRRVILKNILCYKYIDLRLERGLIGVFGRNGVGKSTLLNLMYAILTNDFKRFPGTRVQCINNTAGKNVESYAYGEIEHGEHVLKIRRGLQKPAKSELQIDEQEPITDANKIEEAIVETIGLDATLLDLFVFKQQDKIYDIFVATDAKRKEAFQALNRTEKCAAIYDILVAQLSKDQQAIEGFVDNSDELLQDKSNLEESIKSADDEIAEQEKLLLNETSFESANRILDDWRTKQRLERELEDARNELPRLKSTYDDQKRTADDVEQALQNAIKQADRLRPLAASASAALLTLDQYEKQRKRLRTLTTERDELAAEAERRKRPTAPKGYRDFDLKASRSKLQTLQNELIEAEEWLEGFDSTGVNKCSKCGTVLERADTKLLDRYRTVKKDHPGKISELNDQIEDVERYESENAAYDRWLEGHTARTTANKDSIAAIGELKAPSGDREELQQTVDDSEAAASEVERLRRRSGDAAARLAKDAAAEDACRDRIRKLKEQLEAITITEEKYDRAKRRLEEHDQARQEIAEVRGSLTEKRARLKRLEEDLDRLDAKAVRLEKLRRLTRYMERAKAVVHRDGLPTRVSQTNLMRLEGLVNEELEQYGAPFWVETGEDLQFVVHKPGQPPMTAPWLSTGQKVVLAGSFWLTIVSAWTDSGMLCLDEPTANLDEDNRAFLAEALSRLTGRIRGNRQVIMVSHADELRTSFDQVIDLSPQDADSEAA